MKKYVYLFSPNNVYLKKNMDNILGNKGARLIEMSNMDILVPSGLIITTDVCIYYLKNKKYKNEMLKQILNYIKKLEIITKKKLGNEKNPLLVSIRSSSKYSMPGMMDTILNLGINDKSIIGLSKYSNNEMFAYDCYQSFISTFGIIVLNIKPELFYQKKDEYIKRNKFNKLTISDLKMLINDFKNIIKNEKKIDFPQDPYKQLFMSINAIFNSWNNKRAKLYRSFNNIPENIGTAVIIQEMIYGNKNYSSGTGVIFTRNPSNGNNEFFGEYLIKAQGEDLVSGLKTPYEINSLKINNIKIYNELTTIGKKLEKYYKDMQDIEFTIEDNKLYILQTRSGKRTSKASFKIAVDMVKEKLITKKKAILYITPENIKKVLYSTIDVNQKYEIIATGLPASPGVITGKIAFSSVIAKKLKKCGEKVILIKKETSPEDIDGMYFSDGLLTSCGGMTSHAAVIGRGMGIPCIVGCNDLKIDYLNSLVSIKNKILFEKEEITIDGNCGNVIFGNIKLIESNIDKNVKKILSWCDDFRKLKVFANAETINDIKKSIEMGADGIGLCRTEHMFFEKNRISLLRNILFSSSKNKRFISLKKLLLIQKEDYKKIFLLMNNKVITIRYLDIPINEFLPNKSVIYQDFNYFDNKNKIILKKNETIKKIIENIDKMKEINPMLGFRGCRLGIVRPEIYNMQTKAIFETLCELYQKKKINIHLRLMIPFVNDVNELKTIKFNIQKIATSILKRYSLLEKISYEFGTMIELPRACITADKISSISDFLSFGTNDLTQTTFGFSRDDTSKYLSHYLNKKIYKNNPFVTIDKEGVGELIKIGIKKCKLIKKNIDIGICGEHGSDPNSITFANSIDINYISCSPFNIPIVKLICAQLNISKSNNRSYLNKVNKRLIYVNKRK